MAMGAVIAGVSIAATAIGTGMSVMGQINQAAQQRAVYQAQATQAEYQARYAADQAKYQASYQESQQKRLADYERQRAEQMQSAGEIAKMQKEQEGQRLLSRQLAVYGASGVEPTSGSPLAVMEETAAQVERDALMERYKYQLGAQSAEMSSDLYREQASAVGAIGDYQSKFYKNYGSYTRDYGDFMARSVSTSMPWKVGGTLITGLSPLLNTNTWKPLFKG